MRFKEGDHYARVSRAALAARTWKYLRPQWARMVLYGLSVIASAIFGLAMPFITGDVIDALVRHRVDVVALLVGISIVASGLAATFSFAQSYNAASITRMLGLHLSEDLFGKLQRVSLTYHHRTSPGEMVTVLRTDVDTVSDVIYSGILPFLASIAIIVSTAGSMLIDNWRLSLAAFSILPVWIFVIRWSGQRLPPLHQQLRELLATHNSVATERLSLQSVIRAKTNVAYDHELRNYQAVVRPLTHLSGHLINTLGKLSISNAIVVSVGPALILILGAWLVENHSATVGTITAFLGLQSRLFSPIQSAANIRAQMPRLWVALERIFDVMTSPIEQLGDDCETEVSPPIAFSDVHVAFSGAPVLEGVTFELRRGLHAGLVGPSGSGKSTLAALLLGLKRMDSGGIYLNGLPIESFGIDHLRSYITYVPQDGGVFAGTVEENLRYGAHDRSDDAMRVALSLVGLSEKVDALPDGMHTDVGINGSLFSGGERQRLAIARALLRETAIYIFDEATSAIDTELERKILDAVRSRLRGKTVLFITHRLTSLADVDSIFVLHGGTICERGDYTSLIRENGFFTKMIGVAS